MKYIVAGGRDFNNYGLMTLILSRYINPEEDTIISGGARGADELGARYASEHGVPLQIFPAYWDTYGKSAGFIRNAEMGEHADGAIVFWDGKSKGSKHMIKTMKYLRKQCYVYDYNGKLYDPNNSRSNS